MAEDGDKPNDTETDPVERAVSGLRSSLPQFLLLTGAVPVAAGPQPYQPPTAGPAGEARAALHQRALQDISRERFGFPTPSYRDYKTYTNVPERSMGVAMPNGIVAYPDIVVVQDPENYAKILGEVETAETVTEDVARYRWLPFAKLAPLYLYVPVGQGDRARRLSRALKVPLVGIHTWRYAVGVEEIEINDHFTVASGPEEMLPPILRRG